MKISNIDFQGEITLNGTTFDLTRFKQSLVSISRWLQDYPYSINDFVCYDGKIYRSKQNNNGRYAPPGHPSYWEQYVSGGNTITVDDSMSSSSTNPVQNKVIYNALQGKANTYNSQSNKVEYSQYATRLENSRTISLTGIVSGSGSFNGSSDLQISTSINESQITRASTSNFGLVKIGNGITVSSGTISIAVDTSLSNSSTNPVQNKVIKSALDEKITTPSGGSVGQVLTKTNDGVGWATVSGGGGSSITIDTEISLSSTNPVENRVIKTELDKKLDAPSTSGSVGQFLQKTSDGTAWVTLSGGSGSEPLGGTVIDSLIFKIPQIYDDETAYFKIQFSETDVFSTIEKTIDTSDSLLANISFSGGSSSELQDGNGTSTDSPYLWQLHCQSDNKWQSDYFNSPFYIKMRLKAGNLYDIGMTFLNLNDNDWSQFITLYAYDEQQGWVVIMDDYGMPKTINNIQCQYSIPMSPTEDADYIIYVGTREVTFHSVRIIMSEAPQFIGTVPSETISYPNGFTPSIDVQFSYRDNVITGVDNNQQPITQNNVLSGAYVNGFRLFSGYQMTPLSPDGISSVYSNEQMLLQLPSNLNSSHYRYQWIFIDNSDKTSHFSGGTATVNDRNEYINPGRYYYGKTTGSINSSDYSGRIQELEDRIKALEEQVNPSQS